MAVEPTTRRARREAELADLLTRGEDGRQLPLAVVAVGAWGTVHPSAVNSLVRLGIPPDAVPALLKKAAKITARHAVIIARCRFAEARRNMPRAV